MEGIQASKGYSLTEEQRQMVRSGHKRNLSKQVALTNWRQTDRQVRPQKKSEQLRGLRHSHPGEQTVSQVRAQRKSERPRGTHILESTDRQTDRQTGQGTERIQAAKGTHVLESADGWTSNKINKTPGHTKRRTDVILNVFCEPESLLNTG